MAQTCLLALIRIIKQSFCHNKTFFLVCFIGIGDRTQIHFSLECFQDFSCVSFFSPHTYFSSQSQDLLYTLMRLKLTNFVYNNGFFPSMLPFFCCCCAVFYHTHIRKIRQRDTGIKMKSIFAISVSFKDINVNNKAAAAAERHTENTKQINQMSLHMLLSAKKEKK